MKCFECKKEIEGDGVQINLHFSRRWIGPKLNPLVMICESCAYEIGAHPTQLAVDASQDGSPSEDGSG